MRRLCTRIVSTLTNTELIRRCQKQDVHKKSRSSLQVVWACTTSNHVRNFLVGSHSCAALRKQKLNESCEVGSTIPTLQRRMRHHQLRLKTVHTVSLPLDLGIDTFSLPPRRACTAQLSDNHILALPRNRRGTRRLLPLQRALPLSVFFAPRLCTSRNVHTNSVHRSRSHCSFNVAQLQLRDVPAPFARVNSSCSLRLQMSKTPLRPPPVAKLKLRDVRSLI